MPVGSSDAIQAWDLLSRIQQCVGAQDSSNRPFSTDVRTSQPSTFNAPSNLSLPPPAYTQRLKPCFPPSLARPTPRPRVFSAPSFSNRVSTLDMERGGVAGDSSACSSRSASQDRTSTCVPLSRQNSLPCLGKGVDGESGGLPLRRVDSAASFASTLSYTGIDPDDPRITGARRPSAEVGFPSYKEGEAFLLLLTEALMRFGAPSHRIESQLLSVAASLHIKLQVIHVPGVTIMSFSKHIKNSSAVNVRFVKASTKVDLGRLHDVHVVYKKVVHYEETTENASSALKQLLKRDPIFNAPEQIMLAVICGLILSPMAYKGSVLDLVAAGLCCGVIAWLHLWAAKKNAMFSNFVEITSAIFVAFTARGLSSLPQGIFCYSAVASAGVVKLLPKYMIICGSLELASKQVMTGSVKMVYAIIWSLFLGFSITLGSDLYYLIDSGARSRRFQATQYLADAMILVGDFSLDNTTTTWGFHFSNVTAPPSTRLYSVNGCYRSPDWPWYLQSPPPWTLLFLVPLYAVFSAFAAFQPLKSRELPVMVLVSCCSYAANRGVHVVIPSRGDISGAIGAFVIGAMGHLYSRIFHGTAFIAMFNGIGFLVPSAIAATGGLAQNYRGKSGNHYTSSLDLAMRMIQVAIGTTMGLYTSALVVYSVGKRKKGALWAF